jgi:hypothetical protein
MAFEVKGVIYDKMDTQVISDRFKKRDFVIEIEDGAYKQHIKFQLTQDRCDLVDNYEKGDEVKVSFNLRGRPYQKGAETIYFTNLEAWRLEKQAFSSQNVPPPVDDGFPSVNDIPPAPEVNDDLPF